MTGLEGVDVIARVRPSGSPTGPTGSGAIIKTRTDSFARATGLFGYVRANSENDTTLTNEFDAAFGALIVAGPRAPAPLQTSGLSSHLAFLVDLRNASVSVERKAAVSKRALAGGGRAGDRDWVEDQDIRFSADVRILSGRTPELIVASNGTIALAVNNGNNFPPVPAPGSPCGIVPTVTATTVQVNDIKNPGPGDVVFTMDVSNDADSKTMDIGDSAVVAGTGTWTFRDSLAYVRLTNHSNLDLRVDNIDVLSSRQPFVYLQPDSTVTLEFNIAREVTPTLIDIRNLGTGDVLINGTINNPIGTTSIVNTGGSVLGTNRRDVTGSDGRQSLIRTNILLIETTAAGEDVGNAAQRINVDYVDGAGMPAPTVFAAGRVSGAGDAIFLGFENRFLSGQVVRYEAGSGSSAITGLTSGSYYRVIVSADGLRIQLAPATGALTAIDITPGSTATHTYTLTPAQRFIVSSERDVYLDVRAVLRDTAAVVQAARSNGDYVSALDLIDALRDADVLLRPAIGQTGSGNSSGVRIQHPGGTVTRNTFFLDPDGSGVPLHSGAFGEGATNIPVTYDFRGLNTSGQRVVPGLVAGRNVIVRAAEPLALPSTFKTINVLAITELLGTGYIDVHTNGWIEITEQTGDLQAGRIHSTLDDVTLYSPAAILDQRNDPYTAIVESALPVTLARSGTSATITRTSGSWIATGFSLGKDIEIDGVFAGVVSTVSASVLTLTTVATTFTAGTGTHKVQVDDGTDVLGVNITMWAGLALATGGIGTQANFLETDVDVANGTGVLNAYDRLAASTAGIYVNETHGALKLDTVWTKADAALAARAGSIVDARGAGAGDDAANVIATNIDLDANGSGSSIGDPSGGNDLEIESQHTAAGDVGLEAGDSIYLTEVRGTLRLVLAEALAGDIRITVRETDTDTPAPASAGSFTGAITFDGATLTRAGGSFVTSGFLVGHGTADHRRHAVRRLVHDRLGQRADAHADRGTAARGARPHERHPLRRHAHGLRHARRGPRPAARRLGALRRERAAHRPAGAGRRAPGLRAGPGRRRRGDDPEQPDPRRRADRHLRRLDGGRRALRDDDAAARHDHRQLRGLRHGLQRLR